VYLPSPVGQVVLAKEFALETRVNPDTKEIKAVKFRVAGAPFNLALGCPDNPAWPSHGDQTVTYKRVGATKDRPPQWDGWKE